MGVYKRYMAFLTILYMITGITILIATIMFIYGQSHKNNPLN